MNTRSPLAAHLAALLLAVSSPPTLAGETASSSPAKLREISIAAGSKEVRTLPEAAGGAIWDVGVWIPSHDLKQGEEVKLTLSAPGQREIAKTLNAGDTSLSLPVRLIQAGALTITASNAAARELPLNIEARQIDGGGGRIEAEPNNAWSEAQPYEPGTIVYGNADEVDYLDNAFEAPVKNYANGLDNAVRDRPGLDWFVIRRESDEPVLVIFELDVLDRDVSVNLRTYIPNADGSGVDLFLDGRDPMEIVHDREPERYSKSISRVLRKGTYYLQVNGNHPRYTLRSKVYGVPPYANASDAVRAGSHYIMDIGDAWLAQVPREGNIHRRVQNLHDTSTRCTACHATIFPTEAVLTARAAGYAIEAKSQFQYVVDRIYNSPQPLYGDLGLNWQRYIAIPLQSQGKGAGVLMDFERIVSRREAPEFMRFAPFLKKAWTAPIDRLKEVQVDEENGVVPLDSNVGYGVRDWRVLMEAYRRTGDRSLLEAAENIRTIVTGPRCDQKNLQDKLHRIWGLALMSEPGEAGTAGRAMTAAAIEEIMALQNADGGWPESLDKGAPSAVYATGQTVWTLVQAGETLLTRPELRKATEYLLSQQQPFGGWFQSTTKENFQTPMRETRYAVMALAATHPLDANPVPGWGNRGGGEGRAPRTDSLLNTLDDLDVLWQTPEGKDEAITQSILPLLTRPEPLIRSAAAECLGRVGTNAAIEPLAKLLGDPLKDVQRSAAWALRQFGNRGEGVEVIAAALESDDPVIRRGAVRIFAQQYYGLDQRLDLAGQLMKLTADPDLWTRLGALKSLRQWFYRSNDDGFRRRVVDLYIERMDIPDHPAVESNLAQGMYIMLDENQTGGVNIERNIARLPEQRDRDAIIEGRRHTEKAVLLEPVLEAMEHGTDRQRAALLASFDGSFFAGRFYARNPRNMIDVGNDREFGFYYQPPAARLERVTAALLDAPLPPVARSQAVRWSDFFFTPKETADAAIQNRFIAALGSPDSEVQLAARTVVSTSLSLREADKNAALADAILARLEAPAPEAEALALLTAMGRNEALLGDARFAGYLGKIADDPTSWRLALTVAATPVFDGPKADKILEESWSRTEDESIRLEIVDRFFDRWNRTKPEEPNREQVRFLRTVAVDPMASARERLIERLEKNESLRKSPRLAPVLHGALTDSSSGIRLRGLKLAKDQKDFWREADTLEYLSRLLIDPDRKVRRLALDAVEKHGLIAAEPRLARRVKAASGDPDLKEKAFALLTASGADPAAVEADGVIQSFGVPDIDFFREKVNPYFYVEGADGHACVECHQNHNILRIAPLPFDSDELSPELLIENLNSALKVVNLGDPEQSLLLRKPRSPQGQGTASSESATGLTHVGGTRWPSPSDPAYQAVLAWIRDAEAGAKRRVGASAAVDSYSPEYPPEQALDGDPQTIWHTEFVGASPPYPHEIVIDLGAATDIAALQYVPRQESSNGRIREWEVYASAEGQTWGEPAAKGQWGDDAAAKTLALPAKGVRFVKLRGLSSVNGEPYMSAAEVIVIRASAGAAEGQVAQAP